MTTRFDQSVTGDDRHIFRKIIVILFAVFMLFGGAFFAAGWIGSERAMHPRAVGSALRLEDYPALKPETIAIQSKTGITVRGRFFAGQSRATIVLSHGYGGDQNEMLPVANFLHEAGFTVVTYDSRGCGGSGGTVTFAALEQRDLMSVIDYLASRDDVDDKRIGALGFSMGAATTILAAAHDPRIRAVVDDSGWSNVYHWLRPSLRTVFLHPTAPFSSLSLRVAELRLSIDLGKLRPADEIARISPRPVLIIHGTADQVVPPSDSQENYTAAKEPKALWWIQGAGHGETGYVSDPAYRERVITFFRHALHG